MDVLKAVAEVLAEEREVRKSAQKRVDDLRQALDAVGAVMVTDAGRLGIEVHNKMTHVDLYMSIMKAQQFRVKDEEQKAQPEQKEQPASE